MTSLIPANNKLVSHIYNNKDNYLIQYTNCKSNICAIYFSSNAIYYPNTEEEFSNVIIKKDRFEWYSTKINKAKKHIFIRDVYKQWYIEGISSKYDNTEKLLDFLKEQTRGYEIITVGSSAGGYAAILFGEMLKASYILAFSPQFSLNYYIENGEFEDNPLIFKYLDDKSKNKYYDLTNKIKNSNIPIFYFIPIESEADIYQFNLVKDYSNVFCFKFMSKIHGQTMHSFNLPYILNKDCHELVKIYKRYSSDNISQLKFAIDTCGLFNVILDFSKKIVKQYFKKAFKRT
ncbi:hypothetical protein [Bacillus sp. UNC41MFS5]|uniref:hypothetical protein n=1 Tax=Bacillus sp. UNC41MFS5 TaxID=1449046 RepID=UPI0005559F4C|nr:hypothetical protein [Bacillus sp. UNC41MFS5]